MSYIVDWDHVTLHTDFSVSTEGRMIGRLYPENIDGNVYWGYEHESGIRLGQVCPSSSSMLWIQRTTLRDAAIVRLVELDKMIKDASSKTETPQGVTS